ncbi:hypothetical protein MUU72_31675 [Streptomyces sp. RS10V-4]|uniref:hypothetical protein n=1 Tax=Streptomyces rhizoryzae TaxID=2932493 RepID=UPI002002A6AA|nr:hypothetical protein [Streptomyces rhizoryzae]MCK7627602.1 hypothetical protein [Streptomyces rhizoryzae]
MDLPHRGDDAVDALISGQIENGPHGFVDAIESAGADASKGKVGVCPGLVAERPVFGLRLAVGGDGRFGLLFRLGASGSQAVASAA